LEVATMVKQMLDYLSTKGMLLITEPSHNHQNQILVAPSAYEHEEISAVSENSLPEENFSYKSKI
jgi:hypothetical protein